MALNAGGVRDSLKAGAIHLVMGTHSVATVQLLAAAHTQAKQNMVSAPVLGRPDAAAAGQLLIVAGGPNDAVRRCEPLFQVMGRRTFEAGPNQEGAAAIKLSNNFVLGCAIEAMGEAFSLVRKYGVQPQVLYDVLTEGLFAAPAYKVYGKIIVDESVRKGWLHDAVGAEGLEPGSCRRRPGACADTERQRVSRSTTRSYRPRRWRQGLGCHGTRAGTRERIGIMTLLARLAQQPQGVWLRRALFQIRSLDGRRGRTLHADD